MTEKRKRRSGSMFRLYFIQTSVSVLLCLTIASFAVLFFFLSFWKNDRLTALNDDALSVAQSVDLYVDEKTYNENKDVFLQEMYYDIITAVAKSSATEIFISDKDGRIVVCYDMLTHSGKEDSFTEKCIIHSVIKIPQEIISGVDSANETCYNFEGSIKGLTNENYLVAATSLELCGDNYYIIVMQAESVAFLPYTTEFLRIMIFASLIAITMSCILSIIISYRLVRPLKKITAATKLYSHGDFSVRISASDVYKELTQLVDSVNKMADNLAVIEESRSSFVANVSHELKTPMTIISGFIDGMLDGTISEEDSEKYLTIVSEEVKRLSRLVVAMLNMSKIEAGKLQLNVSYFAVRDIFIKTLIGFEKYIDDKGITIEGTQSLEDIFIYADETLINQIIYNLLDNAVKFTPENGTITLGLREDKKEAVLTIRNTGRGIAQEDIGLLFDRFYKVDKSRGLDAKSFGMGLYIVKRIIELHGGIINVNSVPGSYAEFEVRIPINNQQ